MVRSFVAILAALLLLAAVGAGGLWAARRSYDAPGPLGQDATLVIARGTGEQIGRQLAEAGVVRSALSLRLAALATRGQGPLRAGELAFPAHASLRQVLAVLRAGKVVQHFVTVPEGLSALQVAQLLDHVTELAGPRVVPEEGMFLPETYAFERGTDRAALIERGRRAMEQALARAWGARSPDLPLATPREALILASIVERETARPEERARIAAVFLNRLRRGLRLQSDATVVYGASGGLGLLDHGLTRAELDRDDPYNTYRIPGLPPGPIAMPGLASLTAATHPAAGDELFFVAEGGGGHAFARTEPEHQRNVARWREIERQRAHPAPPSAPVN